MDVSIIIVNYNTKQLTLECINSIIKFTKEITYEIILVDNASSDGSCELFSADNRIRFVQSKENIGFGRANNLGVQIAKGKYLFFLNSDTYLLGNAIKVLYDFAEAHQDLNIGELGVMLIDKKGKINKPYSSLPDAKILRSFLAKHGIGADSHQVISRKLATQGWANVGFICGADVFTPRKVLDKIGLFDPNIFMFAEEIDLAKRMEQAGYSRIVINNSDIVHLGSSSFTKEKLAFKKYYWTTLSVAIYGNKHFKGLRLLKYRLLRLTILLRDVYIRDYVLCNSRQKMQLIHTLFNSKLNFNSYFEEQ